MVSSDDGDDDSFAQLSPFLVTFDDSCAKESSSPSSFDTMFGSALGFCSGALGSPASTLSSSFRLKGSGAPNPSKPSPFLVTFDDICANESSSPSSLETMFGSV